MTFLTNGRIIATDFNVVAIYHVKVKCKKVLNWALPYLAIATMIYIIMYPQLIPRMVSATH